MTTTLTFEEKIVEIHEKCQEYLDGNVYQTKIEKVEGKPYYSQMFLLNTGETVEARLDFRSNRMEIFPRVETLSTIFFIDRIKKDFPKLLAYWEIFAKEMDCELIQFQEMWLRKELTSGEAVGYFIGNGYRYIEQSDAIYLGNLGLLQKKAASYVKELKEDAIPKVIYSIDKVIKAFKQVAEDHPSLVVFPKKSETNLSYYYLGHHGEIQMKAENGVFHLRDEEIGFHVLLDDLFESETLLIPLIEKIEIKRRVKNLFDVPTYHIKNKIRTSEPIIKAILDVLKKKHSIKEIEDYFAKDYEHYEKTVQVDYYELFRAMDTYFMIRRFDDTFFNYYENVEEAKQFFTDIVFRKFE